MAAPITMCTRAVVFSLLFTVPGMAEQAGRSEEQKSEKNETRTNLVEKESWLFRQQLPSTPFSEATRFSPTRKPAPVPAPSVSTTKRDAELLDRKRNWIFVTPDDAKVSKTQSVEEAFGVENFLGEKKSKGVVSQFLRNDREVSMELPKEQNEFLKKPETEIAPRDQSPLTTQRNLDPFWQQKVSSFSPEQSRMAELWREQSLSTKSQEERLIRMKSFDDLFQPKSGIAANANAVNVLGQNILAQPSDPAPRTFSDPFNPVATTSPNSLDRLGPAVRTAPTQNILESSDANARVFGTPLSAPLSATDTKKPERPPANLQIPKRKL